MFFLNASTVVAGTLLLAVSPMAETLQFTPKASTTLVRTLDLKTSMTVETATIMFMDQEVEAGSGLVNSGTRQVRIVDELGKVEDGLVLDFVRTYEGILEESTSEGAGEGVEVRGADGEASDLEGQKVKFTWDAEEDDYVAEYVGEEDHGEDEWLGELTASLDMVNWLPDDEVEVGGKWEISLDELAPVLWYGGRLYPIQPDSDGGGREGMVAITVPNFGDTHVLSGSDGQIRLTLERVEEEGGGRIAFVTFELAGTVDQNLADAATAINEAKGDAQVFDAADQSIDMTGSGELRWNLETGQLVSLTLDVEQEIEENAEWSTSAHGMDLDISFNSSKNQSYQIELGYEQGESDK
ncbi:MAG: hypothetical protein P1V35_05030 [Planctomycetota bacterium]|nr:hypothetical protein [Planctomycetota bacterium]